MKFLKGRIFSLIKDKRLVTETYYLQLRSHTFDDIRYFVSCKFRFALTFSEMVCFQTLSTMTKAFSICQKWFASQHSVPWQNVLHLCQKWFASQSSATWQKPSHFMSEMVCFPKLSNMTKAFSIYVTGLIDTNSTSHYYQLYNILFIASTSPEAWLSTCLDSLPWYPEMRKWALLSNIEKNPDSSLKWAVVSNDSLEVPEVRCQMTRCG